MTDKTMTKEEIQKAVETFKPNYDIEKPIQELMNGHYLLCGYAYNVSKELIKYKKAFEIFKRLNGEHLPVFLGIGTLSQEEYETLEELMKDENC